MIDSLITSKTRVKLLLKFFLNPENRSYLRELSEEFGESTNAVRVELNRLAEAGLLQSQDEGRTKLYKANTKHPLFPEIRAIVTKTLGIDQLVDQVIRRLGNVELAFITGDYAKGIDSGLIDLVLVGDIDRAYLRKIRVLVLTTKELQALHNRFADNLLVIWEGKSSLMVNDKGREKNAI